MHAEFYKGNPAGCERVFRHMKTKPRKGRPAATSKQEKQQKPHSYGPPSPTETSSFMSYANMMMEKMSQMISLISSDAISPPPNNGIAVSPETLPLRTAAVSPSGGMSPPLQSYPTPPLPDTKNSMFFDSTTEIGQQEASASFGLTGVVGSPPVDVACSSSRTTGTNFGTTDNTHVGDWTEMDLEPLPFDASSDSSTVGSNLSDRLACSFNPGQNPPEIRDDSYDFSKQSSGYSHTKPKMQYLAEDRWKPQEHIVKIQEQDALQQLWMDLSTRCDLLQPQRIQGLIPSTRSYAPLPKDITAMNTSHQLLEPRSIEEMVATPHLTADRITLTKGLENWFDYCPSMTPEQQGVVELMLPVALPAILYMFNISAFGYAWALLLIVGHSTECLCTDWGGTAWSAVRWIGPLQHLQMDLLWNHAMITSFFLSGPAVLGKNCYYVSLCLVPTLPTLLCVSLKSHFCTSILTESEKKPLMSKDTSGLAGFPAMLLKKSLACQLQRSTYLYFAAMALLALSFFCGNSTSQSISLFLFNICPILADLSYGREFAERIEALPLKRQTLLTRWHVDWLQTSLFRKVEIRDKVKVA
jgi:hypothetical protein